MQRKKFLPPLKVPNRKRIMSTMADIYKLEEKLINSKEYRAEKHHHSGCCYEVLKNCTIKGSKLGKVIILIRICKCGNYNDKSELRGMKEFALDDLLIEGVEIHVADKCHFKIGIDKGCIWTDYNFRKLCYCPSGQQSYQH